MSFLYLLNMIDSPYQPAKNTDELNYSSLTPAEALEKRYQEMVLKQHIQHDSAQIAVLKHLQELLNQMQNQSPLRKLRLPNFSRKPNSNSKSLYIFGDVGRGKSMLMEFFFAACPVERKRRLHFHNFMLEVHEFIHQWRQHHDSDPIAAYAKHIRTSTWLFCFDEFNVTDIADAMILTRLFEHLFAQGLIFVATSNYHPDDLYQNGLQRGLFLPFIKQLKQAVHVLELAAKEDYRLVHFKSINQNFYIGLGSKANAFLQQSFATLTNNAKTEETVLHLQGRQVHFNAAHADVLYSSFDELCHRALGAADYIKITNVFNTVFIADIPQLSKENRDQARRFVTLIDALYEGKVKIICTAAVSAEKLYLEDGVFEFRRTQSRLMEMQSEKYNQTPIK